MFRLALVALGAALFSSAPALAQSFSHSHGTSHGHGGNYHSHDTTAYTITGTCCELQGCAKSHAGHTSHSGHSSHTRHTGHSAHTAHRHAPVTTRTYTRTYSQAPAVTRTYTRTAPRRVYVQPAAPYPRDTASNHTDRAEPWAHYDQRWKSRTSTRRHRHR